MTDVDISIVFYDERSASAGATFVICDSCILQWVLDYVGGKEMRFRDNKGLSWAYFDPVYGRLRQCF